MNQIVGISLEVNLKKQPIKTFIQIGLQRVCCKLGWPISKKCQSILIVGRVARINNLQKQFISLAEASGDLAEEGTSGRNDAILRQSLMNFTIPMIEPMKQLVG